MNEEPPREKPDFHIYVHRHDGAIDITDAVMDIYDIAINSMDFGSGFLSTEEVGNIRTLGKAIDAKRFDYQYDKCLRCGCTKTSPCHYVPGFKRTKHPCSCDGFVNAEYCNESS